MSNLYFNDIKCSLNDNRSFYLLEFLTVTYLGGKFNYQKKHCYYLSQFSEDMECKICGITV